MKIDWKRVLRTLVQSASGGAVALITAIVGDMSEGAIVTALIQFASTVAIAVCMNINKQCEESEESEESGDE